MFEMLSNFQCAKKRTVQASPKWGSETKKLRNSSNPRNYVTPPILSLSCSVFLTAQFLCLHLSVSLIYITLNFTGTEGKGEENEEEEEHEEEEEEGKKERRSWLEIREKVTVLYYAINNDNLV